MTVRKDPKKTSTRLRLEKGSSSEGWTRVLNKDPALKYAWVYMNAEAFGVEHYEDIGWSAVLHSETGVKAQGRRKAGEPIVKNGHLLMCIPNEDWEDIQRFGDNGDSGQEMADKLDEKLIKDRRRLDLFRGIGRGISGGVEKSTIDHEQVLGGA